MASSIAGTIRKGILKSQLGVWSEKDSQGIPGTGFPLDDSGDKPYESQTPRKHGDEAEWRRISSVAARSLGLASRFSSISKERTTQETFWSGIISTGRRGKYP